VRAALRTRHRPVCAYVYDRERLRGNARAVREALPPGALLCYAVKANSHREVVATLAAEVDGLEVASGGELALAVRTGTALVVFGGPAKTDEELGMAVRAGAVVNVESVHELRRLAVLAAARPDRQTRVAVRVNRASAALPGTLRMTGGPSPFGVDEAQLSEVLTVARQAPALKLVGFHLHAVSNNLDAVAHAAFVAEAVRWSVTTAERHGVALEMVNVGGGFGVDYTGGTRFDLDALRRGLAGATGPLPPAARLVFEPGRLLAASAGWYAAEVLDVKASQGRWFAVLRGGTHHLRLPAAWGYSHPFTVVPVDDWPYPHERPCVENAHVDVVGELCTPKDVLARAAPVDRLRAGDVVVFGDVGAYGWEISHHEFLLHRYPEMVVI
jgi:diaminopimelate decarboxylase